MVDKKKRVCQRIDVACQGDSRILLKEEEKTNEYRDLARKVKALWKMKKVTVILVVIGALGRITENFEGYMKMINVGFGHGAEDILARIGKNPKKSSRVLRLLVVFRQGFISDCTLWMETHDDNNNNHHHHHHHHHNNTNNHDHDIMMIKITINDNDMYTIWENMYD